MLKRRTHSKPGMDLWTLMVYMVADEDGKVFTNAHITRELQAISAALPKHPTAQVVAQADIRGAGVTRHFIDKGQLIAENVAQRPPGSVGTIRDFIKFGMAKHPADHYMFVFWGHGYGPAGLRYTENFVLPKTLRDSLCKGFGLFGPPIDIAAFMSCQMSTIELAYEFGPWPLAPFTKVADHILASQGGVNPKDESFPYDEILSAFAGKADDPKLVGSRVVDILNGKKGSGGEFRFKAPFALVDVASAKKVADSLKVLASDILSTNPFHAKHAKFSPLQQAMHDALDGARFHDLSLLDLGHLGRRFSELAVGSAANPSERSLIERVRAAGTQLSKAVDEAFVVRRQVGDNQTTGASVFCPTHHNPGTTGPGIKPMPAVPFVEQAVVHDMDAYERSWFSKHTRWSEVVDQARIA